MKILQDSFNYHQKSTGNPSFYSFFTMMFLVLCLGLPQDSHALKYRDAKDYREPGFLEFDQMRGTVEPFTEEVLLEKSAKPEEELSPEDQYILGHMYQYGIYTDKDLKQAEKWYKAAAKSEYSAAQAALGLLYRSGAPEYGVPKQIKESLSLFNAAVKQNHPVALYELGNMYQDGVVVFRDDAKALELYEKSAEYGSLYGNVKVALYYLYSRGVEQDSKKVIRNIQKLYNETDNDAAREYAGIMMGNLAIEMANEQKEATNKIKWLKVSAQYNSLYAQLSLARIYRDGDGVDRSDEYARQWYEQAAESDSAEAYQNLGNFYDKGLGVSQDTEKAVEFFKKAADLGSAEAAWQLGNKYLYGQGVAANQGEAQKWFERAEALKKEGNNG